MPFSLPIINTIPFVRFLGDGDWLRPMSTVFIFAIAALGLNILTGMAERGDGEDDRLGQQA